MSETQQAASGRENSELPSSLRRRRKRGKWVAGLVIVLAAGAYFWLGKEDTGPLTEPLLATVQIGSIENTIAASGSLQPSNLVDVGAQVSGQLQKLHVEVGDLVEAGQLLAEIDARVQQNRVEASRASIEAQEAQLAARRSSLELARSNTERQKRLMAADATSQQDYDTAITNLSSAESSLIQLEKQIEQSRASLSSDETQLEYTRIYAPTAGTVVAIEMNEGRTLNASQQAPTILRIADLSTMTVETEISEADIGSIKRGMDVYFTTLGAGNRRWNGSLRQILPTPTIDNNVVLYTGLFDVDNGDGTLLPEMTAQVFFITSSAENVITVPVGALTFTELPSQGEMTARGTGNFTNPENISPEMAERLAARRASGNFPDGGSPGGFAIDGGVFPGVLGQRPVSNGGRRLASVSVMNDDGTTQEREVIVGVTSRIAAEVISGLAVGERVVAGILQLGTAEDDNANNNFRQGNFRVGGFR